MDWSYGRDVGSRDAGRQAYGRIKLMTNFLPLWSHSLAGQTRKNRNNLPVTIKRRLGKVIKRLLEQRKLIESMRSKGLETKSSEALLARRFERVESLSLTLNGLRRSKRPAYVERQQALLSLEL